VQNSRHFRYLLFFSFLFVLTSLGWVVGCANEYQSSNADMAYDYPPAAGPGGQYAPWYAYGGDTLAGPPYPYGSSYHEDNAGDFPGESVPDPNYSSSPGGVAEESAAGKAWEGVPSGGFSG
jgi:hypothetical protein